MRKNIRALGLVATVAAMVIVGAGCGKDRSEKKYKGPYEGTAVEIRPESNEVSMKMVHPEHGVTVTVKGYVNDKTQVDVNGMTARLEDIRPGDPVKVTGYYENVGDNKKFFVTIISVHKADNDWIKVGEASGASSAPASRAAQ